MGVVVWGDPPPNRRAAAWKRELMQHPGRWGQIPPAGSGVSRYRRVHPDFEFVTRRVDGKAVMFARYVGNGEVPQ